MINLSRLLEKKITVNLASNMIFINSKGKHNQIRKGKQTSPMDPSTHFIFLSFLVRRCHLLHISTVNLFIFHYISTLLSIQSFFSLNVGGTWMFTDNVCKKQNYTVPA